MPVRHVIYRRCPRTPGPGIWSSTWTKTRQKYRHTKVNQHVLADEVPKNTNKNQIPSLRSQLSNHVQSVASPQYKHQWKCAMRRSSLISAFAAWKDTLIRTKVSDTETITYMIHIHFVSTESKPQHMASFIVKVQDHHFNPVRHLRSIVKL